MASEHAAHVCDVCLAEFGREEDRDRHVAETHARHVPQQRTCGTCGACVRGTQNYIRHLRVHYTEYKFACNWCPNFRSRDADTMQAHLETHERRFLRCGLCTFHTRTFRTATDHLRVHLQLPLHVCATCGYRAYSSSRYFNHLDSHGGRRHRCNICNAEFTSLLRKARHKTLVHRRPAAFTCERCGLVLSSTFRLRRHQASHTGHKPFRCQLCGKRLSSRQSLQNHARVCPENDEPFRAAAVVEVVTT
ncbi:zinc finger protein 69 homolog [Pollicipes pollicipes]|nr:zinc finger protein 69 homolog [Pollicipes pollicipes]